MRASLLRGLRLLLLTSPLLAATACHPSRPATSGAASDRDALGDAFARASETEQRSQDPAALDAYLALVEQGMGAGEDGVRAVAAGLDALVWRSTPGLSRVGPFHTVTFRVAGGIERVEARLGQLHGRAGGHPLSRGLLAQALLDLAKFRGDVAAAGRWRAASGMVERAAAVGPLSPAALTALQAPTPVEEGALRDRYPGVGPFATAVRPTTLEADDGALDASALSAQPGVYALSVDVTLGQPQRVWLMVQTTASAVVAAGGRAVVQRPYSLGGGAVARAGWVDAGAGTLRVVVRLGQNEDGGRLSLVVLGADGQPLPCAATAVGAAPSAPVQATGTWEVPARRGPSLEVNAAALLAMGEGRAARRLLEEPSTAPGAALLYARSLARTDDTPDVRRIERARAAYAQALEAWPDAWEAQLGAALHAAARKGYGEGNVESVQNIEKLRAEGKPTSALVRAFEGATAAEVGLRDVALASLAALREPLASTPLLASLQERVLPRVGAEAAAWACTEPLVEHRTIGCLQAQQRRGDFAAAQVELQRLRALRGSPGALRAQELGLRLAEGNTAAVAAIYDAMPPGERTLAVLGLLDPAEGKPRLERDRTSARDTPGALAQLRRWMGDDPVPALEQEGRQAIEQDRRTGSASTAATLVLIHTERYDLAPDGLLRVLTHDVRRVSGTTDVEQGVGGASFSLVGRDMRRTLRRRIHKRDGRTLEPDAATMAAQGNSDLSQLEPGDYIEQIGQAWVLPDRAGQLVVDTPDLLPERTSVRHALLELRHPRGLKLSRWAHPLLGAADEHDEGDTHVLRFRLDNASPRRIEDGTPRMDRDVSLSFGTYTWADVGRSLAELVTALADDDPYVARWARQAAGDGAPGRALVERVVLESGKTIRVPQANLLSDTSAALYSGSQTLSARHILELGQGSRSWVVYRALGALRVPAEVVVAEREPFSADPAFPPRPTRFDHPLVVAHLPDGDVWIDADLPGPPLPAGRVSPELRGRQALRASGEMIAVQGASTEDATDEVDISLKVDERGDARGTFSIQLHGRVAQAIVDALSRVAGADRRDLLRGVVLGWMPWATVNEVTLNAAESSGTLSLRADIVVPSLAQREGESWMIPGFEPLHSILPRPSSTTLGAAYTARLGRQSALAIDAAVQYRVRRRIELPSGWKAPATLPALTVKTDLLEASRASRLAGSTLDETFSLSLASGTVGADAYERFAAQVKRVDDAFLSGVRLGR